MFTPSITAQTAISCITEENENDIISSDKEEIKCLLRAIKCLGNFSNYKNLSKYINKSF